MSKLIILDRDGVINEDSDNFIKSLEEWIPLPGSIDAIARLSKAGYQVAIATNQSGIGRGLIDLDDLETMHRELVSLVEDAGGEVSGIFYCPHHPDDGCQCRKPLPGLLDAIREELCVVLDGAWIVGDSLRDLEAGAARNCKPVLVKTGKGANTLSAMKDNNHPMLDSLVIHDDLASFVNSVLE
jgi:D-glycero-D-manno-heptose 1,7-bisphosphate phosphatase